MAASKISIDSDICENEQVCLAICPEDVFELDQGTISVRRPEACTLCYLCAEACSNGAIELDY